jgi:hypothetical protein
MPGRNTGRGLRSGKTNRMDAEETAFPALGALDDLPKLSPELVAWANEAAAINAEAVERRRMGRGWSLHPACCCWLVRRRRKPLCGCPVG